MQEAMWKVAQEVVGVGSCEGVDCSFILALIKSQLLISRLQVTAPLSQLHRAENTQNRDCRDEFPNATLV